MLAFRWGGEQKLFQLYKQDPKIAVVSLWKKCELKASVFNPEGAYDYLTPWKKETATLERTGVPPANEGTCSCARSQEQPVPAHLFRSSQKIFNLLTSLSLVWAAEAWFIITHSKNQPLIPTVFCFVFCLFSPLLYPGGDVFPYPLHVVKRCCGWQGKQLLWVAGAN